MEDRRLAYSNDRGRTWTHHPGNPVLDIGLPDFRDPKVFWHDQTKRWIMAVVLPAAKKIGLYGSVDLKRWAPLSEFGPAGVWRDPTFGNARTCFHSKSRESQTYRKWVLVVNINPGGPAGGSGTQYFVGEFDGTKFVCDSDWSQRGCGLARPRQRFLRRCNLVRRSRVRWTAHSHRVDEQLGIYARRAHQPLARRDDHSSVAYSQAHLRWLAVGAKASRGTRRPPSRTRAGCSRVDLSLPPTSGSTDWTLSTHCSTWR